MTPHAHLRHPALEILIPEYCPVVGAAEEIFLSLRLSHVLGLWDSWQEEAVDNKLQTGGGPHRGDVNPFVGAQQIGQGDGAVGVAIRMLEPKGGIGCPILHVELQWAAPEIEEARTVPETRPIQPALGGDFF